MSKIPILFSLAALSLTALCAIGCGEGEETAEASLTKAQYALKADFICGVVGDEQFQNAGLYLEQHPGASEVDMVKPAAIPPLEKEIRELSALNPPKGQEGDAQAIIEELKKAVRQLKQEPRAALYTKNSPFNKANTLARHLGLGDCSRNP
jgi:hypothetical protein